MALDEKMLVGLKDWSVGLCSEEIGGTLGDAGEYAVVLTFDDPETTKLWLAEMIKTWGS